jgi:hypothetical protein
MRESEGALNVQSMMQGTVGLQILCRESEQAESRGEAAAILRVIGPDMLLLEMHKSASKLDETFVKSVIGAAVRKPKILQDIVRVVIPLRIETYKPTRIPGIESGCGIIGELLEQFLDAGALFHRAVKRGRTILAALCVTRRV